MAELDIAVLLLTSIDASIKVIYGLCGYHKVHKDFPKLLETAKSALSDTRITINAFSDQCIRDEDVRRIIKKSKRKVQGVEDDL